MTLKELIEMARRGEEFHTGPKGVPGPQYVKISNQIVELLQKAFLHEGEVFEGIQYKKGRFYFLKGYRQIVGKLYDGDVVCTFNNFLNSVKGLYHIPLVHTNIIAEQTIMIYELKVEIYLNGNRIFR